MTIQEILQEIKKIADNNSFVNFSYIGDVEEMKLQPGFEYPGFAVQNYSYDEETKTYYLSMYLISEDKTLEQACLNAIKDIVYNVNLKHLDLGIVIKSDNIQIITAGKLNGAYCSMQLQMTLTSCVCEDKPGYVSSVNGQTGDVILDIPDIERTVIDVNGQTGHVVLDIPEKLSDLYQDIEYATPDFVDEKVTAEHNYTDSVKSNLEDEIGKLVTGVSSVNGSTGDVVIFIPKMTSDLENDSDFIDSEYVDNLIESLNSSVNTNYAKKSELNTAISDEVSRADNKYANKTDIPTDFYTKQEVDNKDKNIIANTSLNFATKTQLNTAIANEVSRADNKYAKKTDIPTNVYTKKEVDDKDKNIIANTSLNFATKTQLNTAISDEVSRADNKYAKKTDIPTDFYTKQEVDDKVSTKQDVLVSGTNIKTINGKDILGSGDVTIETGTDEGKVKQIIFSEMSTIYLPEIVNSVENLDNQIIANASINYLLKTDYIAPDVDKEYVDTEIGKLVTGVSSVNGMTGDVTIETADTKYVDDKFDTLNSSVNANFQVKGDYATNERVNNVEAQIPTDVVEHAEIADFVTNSSITQNYYKKSEVDNKIETLDSSISEHYVKKGEIPQDVYSKTEVDNLFTEYGETVDSTYEKKGHYDVKISEIDSSISDISTRLAGIKIPTDYVKTADYSADKEAQATKDSEQDSNIAAANLNISQVEAKVDNINSSTAAAFGTVTGQISNVSGRVETIENDYVKHDEIEHFVTDSSVADNYAKKSSLEGLITEADADNKYYGKTAGEGLYNYVHNELDREITDLHNKDLEIDSSISDVSLRLKTVKDTVNGLDNVYVKSETYNIDKNAQAEVNQDVTTKLGKINNSIGTLNSSVNAIENAGYATQTWVSSQGYLNAADKTELEDKINDKQDAGDYATNTRVNEVEGKIPEVKDFVTNSSISTNYYNKTEIDNKGYLNKVTADGYYQEKGNYVNETVYSKKVSEIDSSINDISARLKTANDNIANKADQSELANYYTKPQGTALEGRVSSAEQNITGLQEDVQTLDSKITTDYVSNSSISTNYYLKKDVYNKQETEDIVEILRTDISNTYVQKEHYDSVISTLNSSVNKLETKIQKKQDKLVSGTNIKTINNESILGSGNIEVKGKEHVSLTYAEWEALSYDEQMADKVYLIKDAENVYQAPLVSGTNIKTINGNSILGEGNIEIQGGGTSEHQNITQAEYDALTPEQKQADIVYFITDADVVYATQEQVQEVGNSVNTLSGRVETTETEINNIKNAGYATQTWVSGRGYLNAVDKIELEGKINGKQDAGDYATNTRVNEVEGKIPDVTGYATKTWVSSQGYLDAADKTELEGKINNKQDAGDYATNTRVNEVEGKIPDVTGYATQTWVSGQGYLDAADKTELETAISSKQDAGDYALKSEIPDVTGFATKTEVSVKQDKLVSGTNIKTINGNSILGSGNIEIKSGGLEYLTPGTIVKIEAGMDLQFIADLTDADANKARAIQINQGETYYYELISGLGHNIWITGDGETPSVKLDKSTKFTWNKSSFNTGSGDVEEFRDVIVPQNNGSSVGKLYKYLGERPSSETTLGDYINSKIDSKLGAINTILESI